MRKTDINIVSGFLGAGKTTFIKKLIKETENIENTVIIENEFGEVGIDGTILKREGVEVREINSGCICCSVSSDFETSILDVKKNFNPYRIIIEPSGIGKLSDILKTCYRHEDLFTVNKIITVVDIKRFEMYITNFGEFYKDQIKNSNIILFSRLSQVNDEEKRKTVSAVRNINPDLGIVDLQWDEFNTLDILEENYHNNMESIMETDEKKEFENISIRIKRPIRKEHLESILKNFDNSELGNILRAKGTVISEEGPVEFDFVPGEAVTKKMPGEDSDQYTMVIIGENLNREKIRDVLNRRPEKKIGRIFRKRQI